MQQAVSTFKSPENYKAKKKVEAFTEADNQGARKEYLA